ncbi:DUF1499 domain-containing protein [Nitrospira sp. Nam74]
MPPFCRLWWFGDCRAAIRSLSDIQPVTLGLPRQQAFTHALRAVDAEGRIEATDTTRWFGFKGDIVIRIEREAMKAGSMFDLSRGLGKVMWAQLPNASAPMDGGYKEPDRHSDLDHPAEPT